MEKLLFTSESVTEGHPDKVCDAVSDAILDACMAQDPMSRVACETAACTGFVLVTGEITTKAQLDIPSIVRQTVNEIGYNLSLIHIFVESRDTICANTYLCGEDEVKIVRGHNERYIM